MIYLRRLSQLGAGLAGLGLWVMAVNAGNTANNLPAVINFYGAPLVPTEPFPGLHSDQPAPNQPLPITADTRTEDYTNGTQNVAAYFYGKAGGNAGLDTTASTGQPTVRYLYLDLSNPVFTGVPAPPYPFLSGTTSGTITAHISQNLLHPDATETLVCCGGTTGFGLTTITPTSLPQYGQMSVFWPDPANKNRQWRLQWGPANELALKSCLQTSVNASGDEWTVSTFGYPSSGTVPTNLPAPCASGSTTTAADLNVAALSYAPTKGNVTWTLEGTYHVPFSFTIKKQ